ncbi:neuralized-like protein 4 isoform X1 [Hetaerina americana]|uniref:neuralized-like protein 4 isoform X1 n=1 Tax=Hetaerina americana TaxID=62018 RepID=UPI003A7F2D61
MVTNRKYSFGKPVCRMCLSAATTVLLFLLYCVPNTLASEGKCREDSDSRKAVDLLVSSKRNRTGDWVTEFSLSRGDSPNNEHNNVTLLLSQDVSECRGKKIVYIRGVLTGISSQHFDEQKGSWKNRLLFHTTCGTNVAVINDGRTIKKINAEIDGHSVAFTHRPLEVDELLEVKLEEKNAKFDHSFAIGLTTVPPAQYQHINSISKTSWGMYHGNTYLNGAVNINNYGKNLNSLVVGDRIGVMRSSTGSLHFFVNGVDQGPAASNIPQSVYGLVELWGNAGKATIVDS